MRLVQFNDIHLASDDPRNPPVDTYAQWHKVLLALEKFPFDRVVVNGDIADHPSGALHFFDWFKRFDKPIELLLGNHDDPVLFQQYVPAHLMTDRVMQLGSYTIILLDTSKGEIDVHQLDWLQETLSFSSERTVIFSHHPIVPCAGLTMDRLFPLNNRQAVLELLLDHPGHIHIISAHYHTAHTEQLHHLTQHITPAVFYQLKKHSTVLEVDHVRAGFRFIDLDDEVSTRVIYV